MSDDYVRGEMDINDQSSTWQGFMTATQWGTFALVLIVGYAILVLSAGMNWMVAMGLLAVGGIVGGMAMGMGAAWTATVIGLVILGVAVQVIIGLVNMAMG